MTNANEIEHHGVKGQKWGVRRKSKSGGKGKTTYKKPPAHLNDAELKRRIARMEMEKKYSDLNLAATSPGKHYASGIMDQQGKMIATTLVAGTVGFFVNKALKAKFG